MQRIITASVILALSATVAAAQEVKDCKSLSQDASACQAASWCTWSVSKKPVVLPDGKQLQLTSCRWRPGAKAAVEMVKASK